MKAEKKYFTDKTYLIELLEEKEEKVKVKIVDCISNYESARRNIETVHFCNKTQFYKIALPYDLNNPLMRTKPTGKCYCESCGKELEVGEECIKYDGTVFCCKCCLDDYLGWELGKVDENDVDDSVTVEVPMFDYKGE